MKITLFVLMLLSVAVVAEAAHTSTHTNTGRYTGFPGTSNISECPNLEEVTQSNGERP